MSEEILKALMQLFAIIAKQDEGVGLEEREYIKDFLSQQLDEGSVQEYILLFDDFAGITGSKPVKKQSAKDRPADGSQQGSSDGKEKPPRKLTSVLDSVKTLGICKKINKTLTQNQKVVVLVRLFELLAANRQFTYQRMLIIETASMIFNIENEEYTCIKSFVTTDDPAEFDHPQIMIINNEDQHVCENCKRIISHQLNGGLVIMRIENVNLYFLRYIGSSDVFLNGLPINNKHIYLFAAGSTLKVPSGKPIYYSDIAANYLADSTTTRISFNAKNIHYKFPNGHIGLRDINIAEEQGRLVGIMGASGAGKTTLLNVLCGIENPTNGEVLINEINLHKAKEKIEGVIGYIPQDDLLIEELTVYQNLYYNAKLCFRDLSEQELVQLVFKVLSNLGLQEISRLKVGSPLNKKISGGQRKRLNIALELIREPSVLFVDEPTSGLSSRDSENVMDLLRELVLRGKLIFVVIHQPSSDIYKRFDKIIFLDTGGYQTYYGNPIEGITYFKKADNQINSEMGECPACGTASPEIIFNITEAKVVDEFGQFTGKRKRPSEYWAELYKENLALEPPKITKDILPKTLRIPSWIKQHKIFTARDFLSKISNKQYLLINLLEAPALAFILSFIVRYIENPVSDVYIYRQNDNIPSYIFMSIIIMLFIGLTVSAEEIFRDRKILKRESFLNLSRSSYLISKIGILFLLSAIQSFMFVLIGNSVLGIKDMYFAHWLILFSTASLANLIGLNISATFNSAVTIYIVIPLLIIPQMVLGGAMFSFDKLNKVIGGGGNGVPFMAEVMPSRWAFEAIMVNQFVDNKFGRRYYEIDKKESVYDYKQVYYIPELIDVVNQCRYKLRSHSDSARTETMNLLLLLENEISKELTENSSIKFNHLNKMNIDSFNESIADSTLDYFEELIRFYATRFNTINMKREYLIMSSVESNIYGEAHRELRNAYHNDYLTDIVKKKFTKNKIMAQNNHLVQLFDPIYKDPDNSSYFDFRTHFYAPNKHFMGNYFSTYNFNLCILWLITLLLYLTLYYDLFRKLLEGIGKLTLDQKK